APKARNRRAAVLGVLQTDLDDLPGAAFRCRAQRPGLDVALLGEYSSKLALQCRGWDLDRLVRGVDRIAHAREKVRDRICHRHGCPGLLFVFGSIVSVMRRAAYQDDFVIPGMWPLCASSRRQMRQSPNLR